MTEGAGLRQSHFGSGYDAGKTRLQAEVEQLKEQIAAMEAVVEAAKVLRQPEAYGFSAALGEYAVWGAVQPVLTALSRLDAWRKGQPA